MSQVIGEVVEWQLLFFKLSKEMGLKWRGAAGKKTSPSPEEKIMIETVGIAFAPTIVVLSFDL